MKSFESICRLTQKNLKKYLKTELGNLGYQNVISEDGFLFAPGEFPVLLCAHMDTVHEHVPTKIISTKGRGGCTILSAAEGIGGDDRCGIYMVLQIAAQKKCSVLFLEDEEIGLVGASKFTYSPVSAGLNFNYIMEFDRANDKDAVFYECCNDEFVEFIEKSGFYKEAFGSCSDISEIAPCLGVAAVNLSCGYYRQHTKSEYVIVEEMEASIKAAIQILNDTKPEDKFEYVEMVRFGRTYGDSFSLYDEDVYADYLIGASMERGDAELEYLFYLYDENTDAEYEDQVSGRSLAEAVGSILMQHPDITFNNILDWECISGSSHHEALKMIR